MAKLKLDEMLVDDEHVYLGDDENATFVHQVRFLFSNYDVTKLSLHAGMNAVEIVAELQSTIDKIKSMQEYTE